MIGDLYFYMGKDGAAPLFLRKRSIPSAFAEKHYNEPGYYSVHRRIDGEPPDRCVIIDYWK